MKSSICHSIKLSLVVLFTYVGACGKPTETSEIKAERVFEARRICDGKRARVYGANSDAPKWETQTYLEGGQHFVMSQRSTNGWVMVRRMGKNIGWVKASQVCDARTELQRRVCPGISGGKAKVYNRNSYRYGFFHTLKAGTHFRVLTLSEGDAGNEWIYIIMQDGRPGWMPTQNVCAPDSKRRVCETQGTGLFQQHSVQSKMLMHLPNNTVIDSGILSADQERAWIHATIDDKQGWVLRRRLCYTHQEARIGLPRESDDVDLKDNSWLLPLTSNPCITSPWDPNRLHPLYGTRRPHNGVDLIPQGGDWGVYAAKGGYVAHSGWYSGYGWTVDLRHPGSNFKTRYAHLAFNPGLTYGMNIRPGQALGLMGSSGGVTGPHLHFEIINVDNGYTFDPVKKNHGGKLPWIPYCS